MVTDRRVQRSGKLIRVLPQALFSAILLLGTGRVWGQDIFERMHLSGYGNVHSMDHEGVPRVVDTPDPNDLFFQAREFSLFFDFDVTEGVIASMEMEAGLNASEFTPNYAYADLDIGTLWDCWDDEEFGSLNFRAGRILVPFLWYNENKPNFRQFLMSPPFTAQNIAPVIPLPPNFVGLGWSDVGIMFDWTKDLEKFGLVNLKFALMEGVGSEIDVLDANSITLDAGGVTPTVRPRDGLIENEQDGVRDINNDKATVLKITHVHPDLPVDVGFSWYRGDWDPDSTKALQMWGVHANWFARNWAVKAEWVRAHVQQQAGINPVMLPGPAPINTSTGNYNMYAAYVELSYILARWGEESDRFLRLIGRYDRLDTNDEAPFNPFHRERFTVGTEIEFATNVRFRYEWQRHTLLEFDEAPPPFRIAGGDEHVFMHMFSLIFWF